MASILNPATRAGTGTGGANIAPLAGSAPPVLSGSTSASVNFTLTDAVTNSSGGVSLSYPWQIVARPSAGPPATPGTQDQRNMYANRVVRKVYSAVDATTGQTLTYATFPDVLCNTAALTRISSILVQNMGPEPCVFTCTDVATGDIKIPAYGVFIIEVPMDGIAAAGTSMNVKCATTAKTTDILVVVAYQGA